MILNSNLLESILANVQASNGEPPHTPPTAKLQVLHSKESVLKIKPSEERARHLTNHERAIASELERAKSYWRATSGARPLERDLSMTSEHTTAPFPQESVERGIAPHWRLHHANWNERVQLARETMSIRAERVSLWGERAERVLFFPRARRLARPPSPMPKEERTRSAKASRDTQRARGAYYNTYTSIFPPTSVMYDSSIIRQSVSSWPFCLTTRR